MAKTPNRMSDAEASSLRLELTEYSNQVVHLTVLVVTVTVLAVGYAVDAQGVQAALITLPVIPLLWPLSHAVFNRLSSILRIATYLEVFGGDVAPYERRLQLLRPKLSRSFRLVAWPSYRIGTAATFVLAGALSLCCSALKLILEWEANGRSGIVIACLVLACLFYLPLVIVICRFSRRVSPHTFLRQSFCKLWEEVAAQDAQGKPPRP